MRHMHWIVWAYLSYDPASGNYVDNVTMDLLATSKEEALERAKEIFPPRSDTSGYRIHQVFEHEEGHCR